MGATPTKPEILSQDPTTVPVIRYTINIDVRYKGRQRAYVYESKEYGVSITPFFSDNPIQRFDETKFKDMSNERTTVQIKRSLLEACREYLKMKDILINQVQIYFAVN